MSEKLTYKLTFYFLFLVLLIMPFWPAFIELVTFHTDLSATQIYNVKIFYEPLLILLFLFTVFNPSWEKHKLNLKLVDWLALVYLLWAVASIFFSGESLTQGIQGLRYNGLMLGIYLLGRFSFFSEHRALVLDRLVVGLGKVVAVWSVLEVLIFKSNYWQRIGLLPFASTFGYGAEHKVVNVPQAMATLEGPNQLGSYLLLPFFLLLTKKEKKVADWSFLILMAAGVVLSFSRSAIVGLVVGTIVYLIVEKKISLARKTLITISALVIILVSVLVFKASGGLTRDYFSHGLSSPQHFTSMADTFKKDRTTTEIIIGQGIGTAGPASFNFKPSIQESWYLQILSELGVVGILLWLWIIILILKDYFKRDLGLALALLAVSTVAIFLHTFADNPAVAISLFLLLGVYSSTNFREAKH